MVAPSNSMLEDNTWLADNGANRHIINDSSDIASLTPYYVKDVKTTTPVMQNNWPSQLCLSVFLQIIYFQYRFPILRSLFRILWLE